MAENKKKEETGLELPELETPCAKCSGSGAGGGIGGRCVLCSGSGYELTEFGEQVRLLMRHNFRLLFRELISRE